ncbi:MAG TPA: hypothetical protein VHF65_07195 [Nitrososphaera sp.]|jgi:hypothetical protein|nr:hypothetical protein [Nitrososphaera sp.]
MTITLTDVTISTYHNQPSLYLIMVRKTKARYYGGGSDKYQIMIVSALEYYEEGLNSLLNNQELVSTETDLLENYLKEERDQADDAAYEVRMETTDIGTLLGQKGEAEYKYKRIIQDALNYYINGLNKSEKIISEKLGKDSRLGKDILHYYGEQKRMAKSMRGGESE